MSNYTLDNLAVDLIILINLGRKVKFFFARYYNLTVLSHPFMLISMNENYVVETDNLTKVYGNKTVLDHVSLHVAPGDIYGFIGKNGAGKTTLMKLVLGTAQPTEGSIKLFGSEQLNAQRRRIGALIEAPALYKDCSAYENMKRFGILADADDQAIHEILQFVGLGDVGQKKVGKFSLGMKQRLGIAIAMLGKPELLVLDEPVNGLDPAGIKEIRDLLLRLNREQGVTILVSSHLLDELAKITTRYGIINQGRLVEETTAAEMMQRCHQKLHVVTDQPKEAAKMIQKMYPQAEITFVANGVEVVTAAADSAQVNQQLVQGGVNVQGITFAADSMEEYFIQRMGGRA
ncbi:MAG: ABC transporter ATP-binding protein [Prevotella sp.]|nr:ABC transporter ATP-binding protein [Prevotella sp.]